METPPSEPSKPAETWESFTGSHPEDSSVPLTRAGVEKLVDDVKREILGKLDEEIGLTESRCTSKIRQEMNGLEMPLQTQIQELKERVSTQESNLRACEKTANSTDKRLEAWKTSTEGGLKGLQSEFNGDIKALKNERKVTAQEVASSSATALTPESINEQVQVQLRPLQKEISSLKIQLDANIHPVNFEPVRHDTMTKDIAELFNLCKTLESRLDAVPSRTEGQITHSLAPTVQNVENLQALFDASLGEPTLTLATELQGVQGRMSMGPRLPSILFNYAPLARVQGFILRFRPTLFESMGTVYQGLYCNDRNFKLFISLITFAMLLGLVAFLDTFRAPQAGSEVLVESQSLISRPEDQVFVYSFYPIY